MLLALAVTIGIYVAFTATIGSETSGDLARDAYYNRQAEGLVQGHTYLAKEPPPSLRTLADPYDQTKNGDARGISYTANVAHDLSYYRGRLYMYFSVVPALLLFVPYHLLTGAYISHQLACALFTALALIAAVSICVKIGRRCFPGVSSSVIGACTLALGLAPVVPSMLQRPDVYEVPIACAYLFTVVALGCIWRMTDEKASLTGWSAALSASIGVVIGSRPSDLLSSGLLLFPILMAWQRNYAAPRRYALVARVALAAAAPIAVIGLGLAAFNYCRFGSVVEFGRAYQLTRDPPGLATFSVHNFAYNAWMYLLHFSGLSFRFPFAGPWSSAWPQPKTIASVERPVGVLSTMPFIWCAAAIPVWWSSLGRRLRTLTLAALGVAAANALLLCFFFGTVVRYEMAFAPELVLLAVIGVLAFENHRGQISHRLATLGRAVWIVTLLFSVGYSVLYAIRLRGTALAIQGTALLAQKRPAGEVLAKYNRALELDPDFTDVRRMIALVDIRSGNLDGAMAQFRAIVGANPQDHEALTSLGALLARDPKRRDEAIDCYERAIAIAPDAPEAHNNLAVLLADDPKQRERAVAECRIAIRLKPNYVDPRRTLASVLVADPGQVDEGIREYEQLLSLLPKPAEKIAVHQILLSVLIRLQRYPAAVRQCEEILKLDPRNAQAENNLGGILSRDPKQLDEALKHLRAAVALAPDFAEAHNNLGVVLSRTPEGRDEAIEQYQTAIALKPNYAEAQRNLTQLLAKPVSTSSN